MKVGIVCDEYKLPKFMEKLGADGFTFNVVNGPAKATKSIIVECTDNQITKLTVICAEVESWALHRCKENN